MAFERVGVRAVVEGLGAFNRDTRLINKRLREVTGNVEKLEKKSRDLTKSLEKLSPGFRKAGIALTALGAVGGAFLFKATQLAARVETLGIVTETLGKNVGKTKDEIRALEKAVADQGITLRRARTAIALMIQSNIDLKFAVDLAAEAQNAAVIAGVDSSEAFERLVFTITSGNVRMARTLGLQVSFQEAYEKTAASLNKTTLELNQQEKITARTNEVLRAGGRIVGAYGAAMETAGKKVTSLPRHLENVTIIMGEQFIPLFGDAVDALTAFLKGIEEASEASQRGTAAFVATSTAVAGLSGVTLLFLSQLPSLIAGLKLLGITIGAVGGAIGLAIAALGIMVVGLAKAAAENKILRVAFKDLAREAVRNSESFREYERRAFEAAEGTSAYSLAQNLAIKSGKSLNESLRIILREQGLLTAEQFRGIEAQGRLAETAASADRKFFAMAESAEEAAEKIEGIPEEVKLKIEADLAAETQEKLQAQLSELQLFIDTDITVQKEDFQEAREEINQEIDQLEIDRIEARIELEAEGVQDLADLEEKIADLNDRRDDAIERLAELRTSLKIEKVSQREAGEAIDKANEKLKEQGKLTKDNRRELSEAQQLRGEARLGGIAGDIADTQETVGELTAEINELQGGTDEMVAAQGRAMSDLEQLYLDKMRGRVADLDEVTAAWDRQTAQILFNLATLRIGPDPTREEVEALLRLAGPEGLGLVDEAGIALIETFDDIIEALEAPGSQIPLLLQDMDSISEILNDPTIAAEDLAAALRDIPLAIQQMSADPAVAALLQRGLMPAGNFPGGFIRRQQGGSVRRGQPYRVGETGEELFIPNQSGIVIPNSLTTALSSFLTAATSAIPIAGAGAPGAAAGGGTTTQNFNMTIHSAAQSEQVAADFNLLALMGARS